MDPIFRTFEGSPVYHRHLGVLVDLYDQRPPLVNLHVIPRRVILSVYAKEVCFRVHMWNAHVRFPLLLEDCTASQSQGHRDLELLRITSK